MREKEWTNDSIFKCNHCDTIFKVYVLEDEGSTGFCPFCGTRDIEHHEFEDEN